MRVRGGFPPLYGAKAAAAAGGGGAMATTTAGLAGLFTIQARDEYGNAYNHHAGQQNRARQDRAED